VPQIVQDLYGGELNTAENVSFASVTKFVSSANVNRLLWQQLERRLIARGNN
jgi:hypothetical protein